MKFEQGRTGEGSEQKKLPPIKERLATIRGLSQQLGGVDKIPPELLEKNGYKRVETGHLLPVETVVYESLEKKKGPKEAPFGTIETSVPATNERYKEVTGKGLSALEDALKQFYYTFDDRNRPREIGNFYSKLVPSHEPIHTFLHEYSQFITLDTSEKYEGLPMDIFYWHTPISTITERMGYGTIHMGDYTGGDDILPPESAKNLFETLEKQKAQYTDPDGLNGQELDIDKDDINAVEYTRSHNLPNKFRFTQHAFGYFLQEKGFAAVAEKVREAQTTDEMKATLAEAAKSNSFLDALKHREKILRTDMRTADQEAKMRLSAELSSIKTETKQTKKLLSGMAQYFELDQLFSDSVKRTLTEIQKRLTYPGENIDAQLTFDATPNEKYDKNPGAVSGDCTNNKPLPFEDPNIPLSNVKVFRSGQHVGNIYLLETVADGQPVWHLDAIQIPQPSIQWEQAMPKIVDSLAAQAKKKGIHAITVNHERTKISNYDYIEDAVGKMEYREAQVKIPPVNNNEYTPFQGDGHARILWSNDNNEAE